MGLSNDLISQFVKNTNDNTQTKKQATTVYGTVTEGGKCVKIDGSDVSTPVKSTVVVKDGDRVIVTIKNHVATITGNIIDPSASSDVVKQTAEDFGKQMSAAGTKITEMEVAIADRVTAEQLNASNAKITEELTAKDAVIQNELTASIATVESKLTAKDVEIEGKVTAAEGDIKDLKTNKLSVEAAQATYATIENLESTNTTINNLSATHATFEQATATEFQAKQSAIDQLKAKDVEIDGELKAIKGRIDDLDVMNLEAEIARIDNLETDVGDINTLIYGSATGDTIQSSFANAVIAQLGAAQIKSAMIESVSADKITAGDIITNNVRVMSEDGKLLISDETIQISDDKRVRVQIGKDSNNDYSIYIWDADGNLMFSEGGITDSAIKNAIIRNDMVSDEANIHASKLDIDSLFSEINGSSNTIKSTQITVDDEGQTLKAKLATLATTESVDGLSQTVSSQGAQIEANTEAISTKVSQQELQTAKDEIGETTTELSTKYSELEQTVDGISITVANHTAEITAKADSTTVTAVSDKVTSLESDLDGFRTSVSETYATKTDFDGLTIGGRNLLWNTNQGKTHWSTASLDGTYVIEEHECTDGVRAVKITTEVASTSWAYTAFYLNNTILSKLIANTEYVVSFDMLSNVSESLSLSIRRGDALKVLAPNSEVIKTLDDEQWHKYELELTTNDLSEGLDGQCLYFGRFNTVGYRIIKNLKLEKGNKATDWTPAPEDLTNRIASAETRITQNADSIALCATKSEVSDTLTDYSTTSEMNAAIQLSADGINSAVSEVRQNLDNLAIGGRNLFYGYGDEEIRLPDYQGVGGFKQFHNCLTIDPAEFIGKEFTVSFYAKSPNGTTSIMVYNQNDQPRYFYFSKKLDAELGDEWKYYTYTFTNEDRGDSYTSTYNRIEIYAASQLDVVVKKIKVEMGNRATDWTPAPEDMATGDELETMQSSVNLAEERITTTESLIQQLTDSISMLVTDGNGTSLMTQTEDGWTFSTADIQGLINGVSEDLNSLTEEVGSVGSTVDVLQQAVDDLGEIAEYVKITTYEDEPCIELGEGDSEFKLRITNTRMMFTEGSTILAYFNNQSLCVKKIVVEEEFQQGGFVWKRRSNGNLALMWKGDDE